MQRKLLGIISVDFDATVSLLVMYFTFFKYLRKNGNTVNHSINDLQTSRKFMIELEGRSCIIIPLSLVTS